MGSLFDPEDILSGNEHWSRLDQVWGSPVDLETEDDCCTPAVSLASTIDFGRPTFDSACVLKKRRYKSPSSQTLNYKDFIQDLDREKIDKQFYYIGGQILSAVSVDDICSDIDTIFSSVEKLCATTSTMRANRPRKKPKIPDVVECSISVTDLSFDETEKEKNVSCRGREKRPEISGDVSRIIDDLFDHFDVTIASLKSPQSKGTVTGLVKKFSAILKSPLVRSSPRRERQCCQHFKELAEYWRARALSDG